MKHLKFVLVLAIAANVWECGDAKFGEKGEMSPRRRRCYDGSMPKRLKKRDRKLSVDSGSSGEVCHRLYPRVSCCPTRRAAYQILHRRDARVCYSPCCILSLWELSFLRTARGTYLYIYGVIVLPTGCWQHTVYKIQYEGNGGGSVRGKRYIQFP